MRRRSAGSNSPTLFAAVMFSSAAFLLDLVVAAVVDANPLLQRKRPRSQGVAWFGVTAVAFIANESCHKSESDNPILVGYGSGRVLCFPGDKCGEAGAGVSHGCLLLMGKN
ncbi:uncharacterized protein A4U43_C05F1200 [Asparagus officinalis]|uniref:Uncharacterized protein n=1 Tax=Asparagus officinalis TaxID=4686 RepID=A0A5P1EU11_ASPOF|nr:uncharacterized protein A4U43_C05F1200 [Asparagus officinalis]